MSIKIGDERYPDDVWGIIEHQELGLALHTYMAAKSADENTRFLLAIAQGQAPKSIYDNHFKDNAIFQISIPYGMYKNAEKLASKGDWTNPKWTKILEEARRDVVIFVTSNFVGQFPMVNFGDRSSSVDSVSGRPSTRKKSRRLSASRTMKMT